MDKEKILDYVMNSPNNTNRAVLSGMLNGSNEEDNDFSIAKLTITNNDSEYGITIKAGHIIKLNENDIIVYDQKVSYNSTVILNVVLFKEKAIIYTDGEVESFSGNVSETANSGEYLITGDGTITAIS